MAKRRAAARRSTARRSNKDSDWAFHADEAAVFDALAGARHTDSLREYFGTRAHAELSVLAAEASKIKAHAGPRILILPGIMGSKLGAPKPRGSASGVLWIDPLRIAAGRLADLALPAGKTLRSSGVVLFSYAKLILRLRIAGFDAHFFPYDWRLGIDELGLALGSRIVADGKPVVLIAHSMGGLVARMITARRAQRHVRKIILLGTPNDGSFAAVQALRGTYPFVRGMSTLDRKHSPEYLAERVFCSFPGLYHMLPSPQGLDGIDLFHPACWPADGPSPNRLLLRQAAAVRKKLAPPDSRMIQIVGVNQETVVKVRRTPAGFEYDLAMNGDGTVPLARALLPKIDTYFVEESHPNLANNSQVIRAIIDLLRRGGTRLLRRHWTLKRACSGRIDDAQLRLHGGAKIDWRTLNSAQREAALAELDAWR